MTGKRSRALFAIAVQPNRIWTSSKKVENIDDVSGLKLYANGAAVDKIARALGAVPIRLTAAELYDAATRGTVDGAFFPHASVMAYKLNSTFRHIVEGTEFGATNWIVAISDRSWNKLPDDVKAIMTEAGISASRKFCEWNDKDTEKTTKELVNSGQLTATTLTPAQQSAWKDKLKIVSEDWVKEMNASGKDGDEIFEMMKKFR